MFASYLSRRSVDKTGKNSVLGENTGEEEDPITGSDMFNVKINLLLVQLL